MCLIYISKHPELNFIPAKCDIFGTLCFNACYNTFNIHKLKVEQDYYIKIEFFNNISQKVYSNPIQLYGIL